MPKTKVVLTFPKDLVEQPKIYHLVKDFDLIVNILRAQVMPDEEGKVVLELEGTRANITRGLQFLKKQSVHLELLGRDIHIDDASCVDCGACTAVCTSGALSMNRKTWELSFDREKCVLCGLCEPACPVKAIKVSF
jgi:ferredoxin